MGSPMLFAIVVFLILTTCACRPLHKVSSLTEKHERWMLRHKRTYTDDAEKEKRYKIFKNNVNFIEHFNKYDNTTYKLKINKFADLTHEEFLENFTGLKMPSRAINPLDGNRPFRYENVFDVPNTIDWRKEGAVGPVKNQQRCASCWAFSTTGAVEGITKIKTGKLVSLSEQQLVDCATNGNHGCYGGFMDNAFWYIVQNQGITTEANYPYLVTQWYCQPRRSRSIAAQITGFEDVPANNEEALLKAVSKQPVSAAIDATNLWFYSSGVIAYNCGTNINHAILIVGYGTTDDGLDYWLVKNSWGRNWGEQGYFRILRNSGSPEGICGIANRPSYPTID